MNNKALENEIKGKIKLIDKTLDEYLPPVQETPVTIHEAMRYSVLAGGKRLRPVLFLAAAETVGGKAEALLPAACALEMIHTYSLIHDDLPAMDNDDYRRGKPTNHRVFGEAVAILAGDALLTLAFGLLAESGLAANVPSQIVLAVIREVARAAGSRGLIGGQVVDLQSENKLSKTTLAYIHSHKTGALFEAAVRCGALLGGGSEKQIAALAAYAENLGLAFQITDDILDVEGDFQKLGKSVGSDERQKKCTYPAVYGLEESKKMAGLAVDRAVAALKNFGKKADLLRYLAGYLLSRDM